jgi:hypothetical protein
VKDDKTPSGGADDGKVRTAEAAKGVADRTTCGIRHAGRSGAGRQVVLYAPAAAVASPVAIPSAVVGTASFTKFYEALFGQQLHLSEGRQCLPNTCSKMSLVLSHSASPADSYRGVPSSKKHPVLFDSPVGN